MKKGSAGEIIVTVEESQGSVQNVMEAIRRNNNYVFTTPPVLIKRRAMFKDKSNLGLMKSEHYFQFHH